MTYTQHRERRVYQQPTRAPTRKRKVRPYNRGRGEEWAMNVFETLSDMGHEQVVFFHSKELNLRCIVAIHSTVLGPAYGGLRMWPYATEAEALKDVLRLARAMTYKASIAGLNLG